MPDPDLSTAFSQRRFWRAGLVIVVLAGLAVSVPVLYRAWKVARAEALAGEALALVESGDPERAQERANAAFNLSPNSASSLRARSRTAATPVDVLLFSSALLKTAEVTPGDLRHYLGTCLQLNFSADSDQVLRRLLDAEPGNIDNWNLAARLQLLKGKPKEALAYVERGLALAPANRTAQLLAGQVALRSDREEFREAGRRALRKMVAGGQDDESLQALVTLVGELPPSAADAPELARQLAAHPRAGAHHQLLAIQTLRAAEPDASAQAALVDSAVEQFSAGKLPLLLDWLNANGLHARSLELIGFEQACAKRQLFEPWCRAMIAAGKGDVLISQIEADRTRAPISTEACELVFIDAYEALGKPVVAETHWNIALRAANAGNRKAALLQLAQWAERRGYHRRALEAYARLLEVSPEFTPHCYDRIAHLARATDQLPRLRAISRELMERVPGNAVYRHNYAYLSVLAGEDLDTARELLEELLAAYPEMHSARCALALLEKTNGEHERCAQLLGMVASDKLADLDRYLWELLSGVAAVEPHDLSTLEREAFRRLEPVSAALPPEP